MRRFLIYIIFCLLILTFIIFITTCQNPLYGVGDDADIKAPTISITTPKNAETVGGKFTLKGTAWDDKKLNKIKIESDGINKEINASSNWSVDIDASGLTQESHRFAFTVSDQSGKKTTKYVNFNIDNEGPSITITSPTEDKLPNDGGLPYKGDITFKFTVTDNTKKGGISMINSVMNSDQFMIFKKDNPLITTTGPLTYLSGDNWKFVYNTASKPDGVYTMRVYFFDVYGNKSATFERDIDLAAVSNIPTVTLGQPDPDAIPCVKISKNLIINGYANDNSGIDKILYNIKRVDDSNVFGTDQVLEANNEKLFPFNKTIDTSSVGLTNGQFRLIIWAVDNEAISSSVITAAFEIDNSIPYLTILDSSTIPAGVTPLNAKYLNGDFTVDVQCDFNDAAVEYKLTQGGNDTGWNPWGAMSQAGFIYSRVIDFSDLYSTHSFADGAVTLRLRATKGAKIYEVTRTFYIDKTVPTITILSHTASQHVNGAVVLSGITNDIMGLGDKVEVYNPDPAIAAWQNATGVSYWTYTVSTDPNDIETRFGVASGSTFDALFRVRVTDKAGNITIEDIHLIIDPSGDIPKVVLLDPSPALSGMKVSGNLSILSAMDDDDFPSKDMTGTMIVYDGATPVAGLSKTYTKAVSGFPNMSMIIDTTTLTDQKTYTIKINGTDWHGKQATEVTFNFIVDKNAPVIELTQPVTDTFKKDTINFTGKVKDENIIQGFKISYIDNSLVTQTRDITLTPALPESGKQVWTFNFTLNAGGADTGLTGTNIDWADDQWGNNPHLFTLRVTDETGSMSYKYVTLNLDNHNPTANITYPEEGHIIDISGEPTKMLIKGGMNDTPSEGTAYQLNLNLIEIQLWEGGAYKSTIKAFADGTGNFIMPSTAENFTYEWNHSAVSDGSYAIRLYVKDNVNSVPQPTAYKEIHVVKNAYPPIVETITFATKDFYKGTVSFNVTGKDRGTLLGGNGVDKVDMLVDSVVVDTINHNELTELTFNDNFNLDTTALTDGTHEIAFKVTDRLSGATQLTHTKSAGNIAVDNTPPVITAPTYYTLDYAPAITNYSAYLGFTIEVNDVYSLAGDNPQFRITTDLGTQILNWTYFNSQVWDGQKKYTATFNNYIYVFDYINNGPLHIYVKSQDASGNQQISEFQITKALILPAITMTLTKDPYISDVIDATPGNNTIEISGTVDTGVDRLWIKVDNLAEEEITGPFGSGTYSHSYTKTELPSANHTFRIRALDGGTQNILTKNITVDHNVPTVTINNIIVEKSGLGHVSTDYSNISGTVTYSGTYTDNLKDTFVKSDIKLQIKVGDLAWTDVPDANITQKTGIGNPWTWTYDVNTEDLSILSTRVGQLTVQIRASDKADNQDTDTVTRNVIPYIKSITSTDQTNNPVYDVKFYQSTTWANHENRRYSLAQGTSINLNGYNLDSTTQNPVVFLGANTFSTTVVDHHQLTVTIPVNDTTGKSDNMYVRLSDGSVYRDSTNVALYIWKFNRVGDAFDTFDVRSIDMSLRTDGNAFVTFARDHQVAPDYTGAPNDYCSYRIDEGATQAYNTYGEVDPMWFTANAIYDNFRYTASCDDEWTGREDTIVKRTQDTDVTNYSAATGGGGLGDYSPLNTTWKGVTKLNTSKYGSMAIRKTGAGAGTLYLAFYDDDSRATTPVPGLFLASLTLTAYDTAGAPGTPVTARRVLNTNNPGPWNGIALTSANYPVIVFYTATNNKLNLSYNTATYTPGDDSFTNRTALTDGGKYCKLAIDNTNLISVSYQNKDYGLSYGVLNGVADAPSFITLETMANDGITGFNTSICLDNANKPYISYINNSQLNTKAALHLARFTGSTVNKANLSSQTNWEYMKVPSPNSINSGNTVVKWYGTNNWPVVAYKADNYVYIARMVK